MRAQSPILAMAALAIAAAAPAAPVAAAAAPAAGTIASVTGHAFVARDGRLLRAASSMRLVRGDRIVTRADGSVRLALRGGCAVAVGASASATVGSCGETQAADFSRPSRSDAGTAPSAGPGIGAGTFAIALAGSASVVLGIVAATQSGGQPNSP